MRVQNRKSRRDGNEKIIFSKAGEEGKRVRKARSRSCEDEGSVSFYKGLCPFDMFADKKCVQYPARRKCAPCKKDVASLIDGVVYFPPNGFVFSGERACGRMPRRKERAA